MNLPQQAECEGAAAEDIPDLSRRAVMVRVPRPMLQRIDSAAKRLGLSRAAFMLAATAERVEQMEG